MKKKIKSEEVDVLAIGAHPDDVELSAGGAVAKLTLEGKKVAILDLTKGELGTRGTKEKRLKESKNAMEILGVHQRVNLGFKDGGVAVTEENELKIITQIRRFRPKIVLMNPPYERHPDHETTHNLVRSAMFKSGLKKIETTFEGIQQENWRIRKMFCYMQAYHFQNVPWFCIDISETFQTKMKAIKAYISQVYVPGLSNPDEPVTRLSRPEFLEELESRAVYFGTLVGVKYAEPFCSVEPLGLNSFSDLL